MMDNDNKTYCVYKHTSPRGKVYIGITSMTPEKRWKSGYKDCPAFSKALEKYGWENMVSEVLCNGLTKNEACAIEIKLIEEYKSTDKDFGYNVSKGGEAPTLGLPVSKETREKLSKTSKDTWKNEEYHKSHSGENAYWYGKHHSEESIQKIKDNHPDQRGEKHPMYGKHHTDASKSKMRVAKLGKYLGVDSCHAKPVIQLDLNDVVIAEFGCIKDAFEATGAHPPNIKKVINGERNTAGGYRWKYKEVS